MKVLFDTNVVLDLLLDREPFSAPAAQLLSKVEEGELNGYLCATTLTTLHYLLHKALGPTQALAQIRTLLSLFEVAPVTRAVLEDALKLEFADFEDAVLHEAARHAGVNYIITRNLKDFKTADIVTFAPIEFISSLKALQ